MEYVRIFPLPNHSQFKNNNIKQSKKDEIMNTKLMTIFTRTPLHVGCGSSVGAVDQPVARERHTRFPIIPGSAIKGVLADMWLDWSDKGNPVRDAEGIRLLGAETGNASAGSLLIGEGKLLAFPIRSAKNCFAWITCPFVLKRFAADASRTFESVPFVKNGEVYAPENLCVDNTVIFEEYPLACAGKVSDEISGAFAEMSDEPIWKDGIKTRLAIVSDEMFSYFAENACEIANHNRIDDETGVVDKEALFSQENVPSETMFYSVLNSQKDGDIENLANKLNAEKNLLQIGANATTGLGWCSVAMKEVK